MPSATDAKVTYRRVLAIALPVVLSNATVPLQGLVDTAVIGNLGDAVFLAAVTLGSAAISLLLQVFNFLQFSSGALSAQAKGAGDSQRVVNVLARGLILSSSIGLLLIVLQGPLIAAALSIFEGSERAETLAATYIAIRMWAAPAELGVFAISGWFSGQELTRRLFELQLVVSLSNVILNLFLVLGLGMDVDGVALGTLIAAHLGLGYGLWRARALIRQIRPDWKPERTRLLNAAELGKLMRLNRDIFIRTVLLVGAFTWMTRLGSLQGDVVLACNGIMFQIFHLTTYALDGYAIAAESLVGQAAGARNRRFMRRAVLISTISAGATAVLMAAAILAISGPLIDLFTNVEAVRAVTREHFFWAAFFPVVGFLAFQMDGVFVGAAEGAAMRNAMIAATAIYFSVSNWALDSFGNHGVWGAVWLFLLLRGLSLLVVYPRIEARVVAGP